MEKSSKVFVGMDVHKESIDVTLAEAGGEVRRLGQIGGDRGSLLKMVRRQQSKGRELVFVYEAGSCGFWIYREITVREGKGGKDRVTMLPLPVIEPLRAHLERVQRLHDHDLAEGYGDVELPDALARKYPRAQAQFDIFQNENGRP